MLRRWRIGDPAPSHLNSYQSETQPYPGERHNQGGKYCHHKIADSVFYIPHLFSLPPKRSRGLPIAIHRQWPKQYQRNAVFRSAPLSRGETGADLHVSETVNIPIHSPLTRGDWETIQILLRSPYFNPLPSHEGRRGRPSSSHRIGRFQSTPLSRGETQNSPIYHPTSPNISHNPSKSPSPNPPKPQYLPRHFHNLHNPFPVRIPQRFYVHL